ncbi:hypothetical protein Tco_0496667 [Tanacetum coccineum]
MTIDHTTRVEPVCHTSSRPIDLESAQNNALAKLPLLKQGDYDTWRLRIESYIQLQDYTLWEIIEDGNSFKPVAQTTTNADGTSTSTVPGVVTTEEKIQKKNDLKARNELDIDDLYNNLKVFDAASRLLLIIFNSPNVAFYLPARTNKYTDVNTTNGVSTAAGYSSQGQASLSSYIVDLMYIAQDETMNLLLWPKSSGSDNRAYQLGLESIEAQLIVHQKNKAVYEEKIAVLEFEVKDKASLVTVKGNGVTAVKASAGYVWRPKMTDLNNGSKDNSGSWISKRVNYIDPQGRLKDCMFDNWDAYAAYDRKQSPTYLTYNDIDGGVCCLWWKELKFNLFSVSQICDKKNSVLFTETECLILSPDFKLIDERQGPNCLFDIDSLTNSINYQPVTAGNQTNKNVRPQETNGNTCLKKNVDAGQTEEENVSEYDQALKNVLDKMMDQEKEATEQSDAVRKEFEAHCDYNISCFRSLYDIM